MSFEDPGDAADAADEAAPGDDSPQGVFGNLPHTRPGARSPRRGPRHAAVPEADPPSDSVPPADPLSDAAQALRDSEPLRPEAETVPEPDPRGAGLEDVAWAGVAAAAEAATIGVRLATRALEAMRDAVDRR